MASDIQTRRFPALQRPPIVEVVCGVIFEPVSELDPLVLGVYWNSRKRDFPKGSLQPAFVDSPSIAFGAFPMRVNLASEDGQFLLQLQHDRFYMNWRAVGDEYPRFSDKHGAQGLRARALEEYDRFTRFIEDQFRKRPDPRKVELTKVDLLKRGEHWADLDELEQVVPVTGTFSRIQRSKERELNLRFVERAENGTAVAELTTLKEDGAPKALRIESRRTIEPVSDLGAGFDCANVIVNDIFFGLVKDAARLFGIKEEQE